jgi:hypothetical protein
MQHELIAFLLVEFEGGLVSYYTHMYGRPRFIGFIFFLHNFLQERKGPPYI